MMFETKNEGGKFEKVQMMSFVFNASKGGNKTHQSFVIVIKIVFSPEWTKSRIIV